MNEIDVLVEAGMSRTNAEMVVALHTMASTLAQIAEQQRQQQMEASGDPPADEPAATGAVIMEGDPEWVE